LPCFPTPVAADGGGSVGRRRAGLDEPRRPDGPERIGAERIGTRRVGAERIGPKWIGTRRVGAERIGADVVTAPATVTIAVRVKPGSARVRVGGRFDGPYGPALVIAVHPPAVDGRATEAARRALAEALRLRPAAVALRTGAASRDKLFQVDGPGPLIDARLRQLRDGAAA
jgi:uncharacterized protein